VLTSGGYPDSYETGFPISGLDSIDPDIAVFHAGTASGDARSAYLTDGGRVLSVSATGGSLEEARQRAYHNVYRIDFQHSFHRLDIAEHA